MQKLLACKLIQEFFIVLETNNRLYKIILYIPEPLLPFHDVEFPQTTLNARRKFHLFHINLKLKLCSNSKVIKMYCTTDLYLPEGDV